MIEVKPGDNIYEVEKILSKRVRKGKIEYKVKWECFPLSQSTWEPISHLVNVKHLINCYEKKNISKKRKKASHYSIFQDIQPTILDHEHDNPLNESLSSVYEDKSENISENDKENEIQSLNIPSLITDKDSIICPFHLITLPKSNITLQSIETVIEMNNILYAVVNYFSNDQRKTCLIKTEDFYKNHSALLIKYYETKIKFT